jgi:hypothetical protein
VGGSVLFWVGDTLIGSAPAGIPYDDTVGSFEFTTTALPAGTAELRVSYAGDPNYGDNPEGTVLIPISIAPAAVAIQIEPLFSGAIYYGERNSVRVKASSEGRPLADRSVRVQFGPFVNLTELYTLDANGEVVIEVPLLAPGAWLVKAEGPDTSDYLPAAAESTLDVLKLPTTTTLETTPGAAPPRTATITATVSNARGGPAPSKGEVRFYVRGFVEGVVPIDSDGRATLTLTDVPPGSYVVVAVYTGSANYDWGQSEPQGQAVGYATRTKLLSAQNPGSTGRAFPLVAQVTGATGVAGAISGVVRFYVGLDPVADVPVNADGAAVLPARFDVASTYLVTAEYLGGGAYLPSRSDRLDQVIEPSPPSSDPAQQPPAEAPPEGAQGPTPPGLEPPTSGPSRPPTRREIRLAARAARLEELAAATAARAARLQELFTARAARLAQLAARRRLRSRDH